MLTLVLVVVLAALVFEFINGFHDTANSIATVVATKALLPWQAVLLAAAMNLVGALMGTAVAKTIASGLVDTDVEMIDVAQGFGAKVYFGDGTRLDLLRQAGADEAAMILFCMDGDQMDAAALEAVQQAFPQAAIFVRAYDRRAVVRLKGSPARWVVREVLESAVKMARVALDEAGVSEEAINRAEAMYRARDKERLRAQIEAGDLRAARDRIITEPQAPEAG